MQSFDPHTTETQSTTPSRILVSVIATLGVALALVGTPTIADNDDVNIHPASCQAPFLDQAFPMRWHEYFIMNPTTGVDTWVICPITFDNDDWVSGNTLSIKITGGVMSGASGTAPTCLFSVHGEDNLDQAGFVTGTRDVFEQLIPVTRTPPSWTGSVNVTYDTINNALTGSENGWAAAIRCKLPIGHGISQMQIVQ